MTITIEIIEKLLEKYHRTLDDYAYSYGEPGYTKTYEDGWILFANWNNIPDYIMNAIEKQHDIEWSDEWIITHDGDSKAYRCNGNCHGWLPYYYINDDNNNCDIIGGDEVLVDIDKQKEYIEYLLNNYKKCELFGIDLEKHGFKQVNGDFENGMYGRTDDPKVELEKWQEKLPGWEFIFGNLSAGQFACEFNLYGREKSKDN